MNEELIRSSKTFIKEQIEMGFPVTRAAILQHLIENHNVNIHPDTVIAALKESGVSSVMCVPQDSARVDLSPVESARVLR
jgi:hypothetical protein